MHVLITGAAGMIGRKLAERLATDGGLNGKAIDRVTLTDIVAPQAPAGFTGKTDIVTRDLADDGAAAALISSRPDVIFHASGVVSAEAEANFAKGYRSNLDGMQNLLAAIRNAGGGYKPKLIFTSSCAVFGARRFRKQSATIFTSRR